MFGKIIVGPGGDHPPRWGSGGESPQGFVFCPQCMMFPSNSCGQIFSPKTDPAVLEIK
ncbi:MAG: hypothetical protein HW380_619 [Magnetococcales bacterium]|nr:hypothetical protein [Magnetococcales bacterium]